ncbi:MAG: hypothetical protein KA508_06870 [Gammaproteobacteria bacterium]|nr:hypothetical protein [Gammaproteobacteria bacterium]
MNKKLWVSKMIFSKKRLLGLFFGMLVLGLVGLQYKANQYLASHPSLVQDYLQKELGFPVSIEQITLGVRGVSLTGVKVLEIEKPLVFIEVAKIHFFPQWIPLLREGKIIPRKMVLKQLALRVRWQSGKGPTLLALNGDSIPASIDYPLLKQLLAQQKKISFVDANITWELPDQVLRQHGSADIQWVGSATHDWLLTGKQTITLATGLVLPTVKLKGQVQSNQTVSLQILAGNLDLQGDFYQNETQWFAKGFLQGPDVLIQNIQSYYTARSTDPALVRWFSEAFQTGTLKKIDLTFEGPMTAPELQGQIDYQHVYFNYHKPWPAMTEACGSIHIDKNSVSVDLLKGRIGDLPLQKTTALIQWGGKLKTALVEVQGSLESTFEAGLAFLENSPLRSDLANSLKVLSPKGPMHLRLGLHIPLDDSKVGVEGLIHTQGGMLEGLKGVNLDHIAGAFHFSESTLEAQDIQLRLFEKPVIATVGLRILPAQIAVNIKTDQLFQATLQADRRTLQQWFIDSPHWRGTFTLPTQKDNRLIGTFDDCTVNASMSDQAMSYEFLEASDKPAVSFYCKHFHYQDRLLGELSFELLPKNNAYAIQNLSLENTYFSLMAEGLWSMKDQKPTTTLQGTVVGVHIDKGLSDLGYVSVIREASGRAQYEGTWPGNPWQFDRNQVKGFFDLKLDQGRILGVDPGLGRVMGLLNLESIKRRLQLDFSDLFKKGFVFDVLQGKFNCEKGILSTESLVIDGPSAKMHLQGKAYLNTKAIDLSVRVQPHLSSGLPLAAAVVAGHPAVGAGLWLVNKLTGSGSFLKMNRITQHDYQVGGTWDEPSIQSGSSIAPTPTLPH